eukprot:1866904-Alexandrium_andersonii.AAC.1
MSASLVGSEMCIRDRAQDMMKRLHRDYRNQLLSNLEAMHKLYPEKGFVIHSMCSGSELQSLCGKAIMEAAGS